MKTPMTAIIGYAEMLNKYDLDEEERKQSALAIHKEAKRLENLSLQLLDLYVLEHDAVSLEAVSWEDIAAQLDTTLRFLAEKYGAVYTIERTRTTVLADQALLLSLLYNLADNAFKASAPGQTVHIFTTPTDSAVTVWVQDSGHGIAPENMASLEDPFFREDKSRSRALGGAGLGLSLCKKIADIHHTRLHFDSEPGKGTTVSFSLATGGDGHA